MVTPSICLPPEPRNFFLKVEDMEVQRGRQLAHSHTANKSGSQNSTPVAWCVSTAQQCLGCRYWFLTQQTRLERSHNRFRETSSSEDKIYPEAPLGAQVCLLFSLYPINSHFLGRVPSRWLDGLVDKNQSCGVREDPGSQ